MEGRERREVLVAGAGGEVPETFAVGWMEALEHQFGSAPWWLVSAVLHVLVILALGLVIVSRNEIHATAKPPDLDIVKTPIGEPETPPDTITQPDQPHPFTEPVVADYTIIAHTPVDLPEDKFETENNVDDVARGKPEALSDIPLAQTGTVGNLGLQGVGADAFGYGGRGNRRRSARSQIGRPYGPSVKTFETVNRALEWLARHQEPDGHWDGRKFEGKNVDVGITALATLAFLGNGDSELHGKYRTNVFRAVTWLISQQKADGSIGHGYEGGLGYHHAIAGLALAEAYGMAQVNRTRIAAQKAVDYSVSQHQNPYSGWRYKPRTPADMSVTGWFVMQLKAAKVVKLKVDGAAIQGAVAFLDECTHGDGKYEGLVSYQPKRGPTPTMTAVGAVSRVFLGWKPNDPLLVGATQKLLENLPQWEGGKANFYYWYYGTFGMFQVGGEPWKQWNVAMRGALEERQRRGAPDVDGSWDPVGQWCGRGGRVYATAMGALCLEVYWRYGAMHR